MATQNTGARRGVMAGAIREALIWGHYTILDPLFIIAAIFAIYAVLAAMGGAN